MVRLAGDWNRAESPPDTTKLMVTLEPVDGAVKVKLFELIEPDGKLSELGENVPNPLEVESDNKMPLPAGATSGWTVI